MGLGRELEVQQKADPPTPEELDDLMVITYEITDDQRFYQAVGQLFDGTTYVILVDGALSAVQKRASQVQIISSGFEIAGREETDLQAAENVKFARKQLAEQFTKIEDKLAGDLDREAVEPYLGDWEHPALGNLSLMMKDGKLMADVGEFAARLRPKKAEKEEAKAKRKDERTYVMVDPPLIGAELVFRGTDKGPRVAIGKGAQEYTFKPVQ